MHSSLSVLPVAFSGAPGAYSEEAARRFFGASCSTLTCTSSGECTRAVSEGRAGYAVLPAENTITGAFPDVMEAFGKGRLDVVGEVVLAIRHTLLAVPGARLDELSVVSSHPSALAQCRDWLTSWGVATRPEANSAQAALELSQSGDRALGVLGSRHLSERYGLSILAEGISDRPDNRTRFLVAGEPNRELHSTGTRSAVLIGPATAPRLLKTLRIQLEARGAWRARVPLLGSADGRLHLIEFDHAAGAGAAIAADTCASVTHRFLGSWNA